MEYLPTVNWSLFPGTLPVVPRETLANSATSPADQQLTVSAENAPIRVFYGPNRPGAQIADLLAYGGKWVVIAIWGQGGIEAIDRVMLGDADLPVGASIANYIGGAGNTLDATLVAAYAAAGVTFSDTMETLAYSVVVLPPDAVTSGLALNAELRGMKVFDDRTGMTVYSPNPSLCLADYLRSDIYGADWSVDSDSVKDAANANDDPLDGKPRRAFGLTIDSPQSVIQWQETMRAYAGCFVVPEGDTLFLVPDRPVASAITITHSAGQVAKISPLRLRGIANTPTVITLSYTDTAVVPWKSARVVAKLSGVDAGTTPRRDSTVDMPGIQDSAQAMREAIERLNKLTLSDLSFDLDLFDEALAIQPGDVLEVTHPIGLTAKQVRVLEMSGGLGRYSLRGLAEYDPAAYSDSIETTPTTANTDLPNPLNPPAVAGLTLAEEVFQMQDGRWSSRIVVTWTAPTWTYLTGYRVEIYDASSNLIDAAPVSSPLWRSGAVKEAQLYTVRVAAVSTLAVGAWASATKTPAGKALLPSNVPTLTGFEVGGEVRLTIGASTDLDMSGYEVRYGPVACSWELSSTVKFVDFVNAASGVGGYVVFKDAPAGTWDFLACARDSIGQYSPTPIRITITVTLDVNSFLVDNHDFSSGTPTLTGMAEYSLPCDANRYFITEDGVAFGTKFATALSGFTNPLATYHTSQTSDCLSAAYDFGQPVTGSWTGTLGSAALSGSKTDQLSLSPDGSTYTDQGSLTVKTTARFGKIRSTAAGTDTLKVSMPVATLKVNSLTRDESGTVTTLASGGALVQLTNTYATAKSLQVQGNGSAAITGTPDRLLVAPVTGLQLEGSQAASSLQYLFRRFSTAARVILSSDHLEYDVYVVAQASQGSGGWDIHFSDNTDARSFIAGDAYGNTTANLPIGQWISRKIALTAVAGKTSSGWSLHIAGTVAGFQKAVFRNVRVTDGAGTTRLSLWTSGEPPTNADWINGGYTAVQMGPSNSFLAYTFSAAGAQVAGSATYFYKGI